MSVNQEALFDLVYRLTAAFEKQANRGDDGRESAAEELIEEVTQFLQEVPQNDDVSLHTSAIVKSIRRLLRDEVGAQPLPQCSMGPGGDVAPSLSVSGNVTRLCSELVARIGNQMEELPWDGGGDDQAADQAGTQTAEVLRFSSKGNGNFGSDGLAADQAGTQTAEVLCCSSKGNEDFGLDGLMSLNTADQAGTQTAEVLRCSSGGNGNFMDDLVTLKTGDFEGFQNLESFGDEEFDSLGGFEEGMDSLHGFEQGHLGGFGGGVRDGSKKESVVDQLDRGPVGGFGGGVRDGSKKESVADQLDQLCQAGGVLDFHAICPLLQQLLDKHFCEETLLAAADNPLPRTPYPYPYAHPLPPPSFPTQLCKAGGVLEYHALCQAGGVLDFQAICPLLQQLLDKHFLEETLFAAAAWPKACRIMRACLTPPLVAPPAAMLLVQNLLIKVAGLAMRESPVLIADIVLQHAMVAALSQRGTDIPTAGLRVP
eukprot:gene28497-31653_t